MKEREIIKQSLGCMIDGDALDDILDYLMTFECEEDYDEFMQSIVDPNNSKHPALVNKIKSTLFTSKSKSKITLVAPSTSSSSSSSIKKKKSKFSNFYDEENKRSVRKGRHPCNCQATVHELVNNCTRCGRIVCEQEASGPCFFCDSMVCTRYELEVLNSSSKESDRLYNQLVDRKKSKEWTKAIENRNRLISTDKMGVVKNKVFDDQNDYFDLNSRWASTQEKDISKKRYRSNYDALHRTRNEFKLALDFASRTVSVDDGGNTQNKQHLMKGVDKLLDNVERRFPKNLFEGDKGALIEKIINLMEETKVSKEKVVSSKNVKTETKNKFRVANEDFLESVDQGLCLSMHQPWASLLVAGIKVHEGRTWRTDHRGRLWIAAASKEPEDEEILACEQMYRAIYNDPTIEFPKKYPTGCLLGCVLVDDCLPQNEYVQHFPNGESESPFVFVCSSPVILPIFYPIQGQHKIFSLPKELHRTAKAALMSSKWV